MNQSQFSSWFKTVLGFIGGSLVTYATTKGVSIPAVFTGPDALTFYSGVASFIAPIIWGYISHTNLANIQTAAAVPQVASIVIKPSATDGIASAAADPTQPKIVAQVIPPPDRRM